MKRFFMFLLLFFNAFIITFYINLNNRYRDNEKLLLDKLEDNNYNDYVDGMKLKKDDLVKDIEISIGYQFENDKSFDEIVTELSNSYNSLESINNDLVNKKDNLTKQKNFLKQTYNEILEEERKKSTYMISNVPKINQYSLGYPTGCESAALTNLLNYWGVSVKMKDVVNNLAKGDLPYYENGVKYGGNPYIEFVGHPSDYSSYGVYEKPIIEVANMFKSGIVNGKGMSLSEVLNVVKEDKPVIVWVSMNMAVPYVSTSWIYKPTSEKISWMSNEHALLVVGYNNNQVIVSDSLNGAIRYYDKKVFETRYNTYGKRAIYYE